MSQKQIAQNILSLLDEQKRKRRILITLLLVAGTFWLHSVANNWEAPLALIPRTFTGIMLGMLVFYLQAVRRHPQIEPYLNIQKLRQDAGEAPPPVPDHSTEEQAAESK